jgi:uncharacterized protein
MRARTWLVATALAVGCTMVVPGAAGAATDDKTDNRRTIKVTSTGLVRGTPDVLELTIGVQTRARTAVEALGRNSTLAKKVIEVVKGAGVEDDDVQTSYLSVYPVYDQDGQDFEGYSVSNVVTASLRDFDKAGEVIDAATKIAGDEIVVEGISFSFDDNTEIVARARADAVKRAKAQAEQLADAAGVDLGDLLSISEDSAPSGPIIDFDAASRSLATTDEAAPIEPGAQDVNVQVTLIYEIT